MSRIARFGAYAAAFEKAFESDDWAEVGSFFSEEAVYEVPLGPPLGGRFEGRDAILAYFKRVLDAYDRRFQSREVTLLEGPIERGNAVWVRGSATYRSPGVPDFVLELEETAHFEGELITRLEDRYTPAMEKELEAWLAAHGEKLGIRLGD